MTVVKNILKGFTEGLAAGICISLGCAVFLALPQQKVAGALLFCVALLCVCYKGYNLYTGKIGFIVEKHSGGDFTGLFAGLAGNVAAVVIFGLLLRTALPASAEQAETVVAAKLSQTALQTLIRGGFCGILMYLAVSIYREKKTPAGIFFCIPAFILSGFEHSVADMCYFAAAGNFSGEAALFIVYVVLGNTIGAMILPALKILFKKKEQESGQN